MKKLTKGVIGCLLAFALLAAAANSGGSHPGSQTVYADEPTATPTLGPLWGTLVCGGG
jgi:hypothetical protein